MLVKQEKLDYWIKRNYNVLFTGMHGIGKTEIIKATFQRNNLTYLYFSGPTLDAFIDLIGIPQSNGKYIEYILPKDFAEDTIDIVFIDELNRANKRTKNAIYEFTQSKSINGRKFNRLKAVWAAQNPKLNDDSPIIYQVEELDPALEDRFQIQVDLPWQVDVEYFVNKYGKAGKVACQWWVDLPTEANRQISPRRLDQLVDHILDSGDPNDMIKRSIGANVNQLLIQVRDGSYSEQLKKLQKENEPEKIKKLKSDNFYNGTIGLILSDIDLCREFLHLVPKEKLATLISEKSDVLNFIINNGKPELYRDAINKVLQFNGLDKKILNPLAVWAKKHNIIDVTGNEIVELCKMTIDDVVSRIDFETKLTSIDSYANVSETIQLDLCWKLIQYFLIVYMPQARTFPTGDDVILDTANWHNAKRRLIGGTVIRAIQSVIDKMTVSHTKIRELFEKVADEFKQHSYVLLNSLILKESKNELHTVTKQ